MSSSFEKFVRDGFPGPIEEKKKRLDMCKEILKHYCTEGNDLLYSTVTGDKTWVFYNDPENKRRVMEH